MRSAEEWAKEFFTTYRSPDAQWYVEEVLVVGLAQTLRAYSRECVEAWREKAICTVEEHGRRVFSISKEGIREIRMTGGLPQSAIEYNSGVIAAALRALPGEPP